MGILDGKVAIVTGGARGIGRACVEEMVREGCSVLVNDLGVGSNGRTPDPTVVEQFVAGLKTRGARVAANSADIGTRSGAESLIRDCLATFGTIDILDNNAGYIAPSPLVTMPDSLWHDLLRVHVKGTVYCTQAALPVMQAKRSGVILNTGSPGAFWGSPGMTNYAAAKGALHSLTLVLFKELYPQGIRVNMIVPGANTLRPDAQPQPGDAANWLMPGYVRRGETVPERNGPLVAYLVSDECADIHGRTIGVGGDVIGFYPDMVPYRQQYQTGGWTIAGLQQRLHQIVAGPVHPYVGDNPPPRPPRPGSLPADRILAGKVAIVTGGGRGIGRAAAILFAQLGARVVVNDYGIGYDSLTPDGSYAAAVVREIEAFGGQAIANLASVADPAGAQSIVDDCLRAFGTVDILYNNAGFAITGPFAEIDEAAWDAVFDASMTGTFYCTRAVLPILLAKRSGRIINTSSPGGLWGPPHHAAYGAAKGAITAFSRALAKEVYETGITVNTLVPGAPTLRDRSFRIEAEAASRLWSRLDPSVPPNVDPRGYTPDQVAPLTAYLASDECGDITGHTLFAAGETIALYTEPVRTNALVNDGGWTIPALRRKLRGIFPAGRNSTYLGDDALDYEAIALAARRRSTLHLDAN